MTEKKETFHLMAVPRHATAYVLEAGGRFMRLKNKQWAEPELSLIQQQESPSSMVCILDPKEHRTYEMLGREYTEDMSLCKTVYEQNRDGGYRIFQGDKSVVTCKDCLKILRRKNTPNPS